VLARQDKYDFLRHLVEDIGDAPDKKPPARKKAKSKRKHTFMEEGWICAHTASLHDR
jgi:hypothetical protein